jgi:hypothetical protein
MAPRWIKSSKSLYLRAMSTLESSPDTDLAAPSRASKTRASSGRLLAQRAAIPAGVLVAIAVWLVNVEHYLPFFADDGFISLRYSARLLQGLGLTWTDGERVEGYSNLSYVLLCSFFGIFMDFVHAARLVGILGAAALGLSIYRAGQMLSGDARWLALPVAFVIACLGPLAIWSIGGLEASLLAGLVALGYVEWLQIRSAANERSLILVFRMWPLALACWTRPDAPLFVAALAFAEVARDKMSLRLAKRMAIALALPLLAVLLQLGFRIVYYRDIVPNTARIKAEPSFERVEQGLTYVASAFQAGWVVLGLAALAAYAAIVGKHRRFEVLLCVGAAIAWLAYIAFVGGDIFPGWRHALPAYGLLALAGVWGLEWLMLVSRPARLGAWKGAVVVIFAAAGAALLAAQRQDAGNIRAETERWEWAAEPVGNLLRRFSPSDPLLAVEPAGAIAYYSQLDALDMFGLCDRHIASMPGRPNRLLGHDHGDGEYVWQRKPDLMVLSMPWGGRPFSLSGQEMVKNAQYPQFYQDIAFQAIDPFDVRATVQVRVDGKIGIQIADDRIQVPAYFFQGGDARGHVVASGGVGALIEGDDGASSPPLRLTAGAWRVRVVGSSPWLTLELENAGNEGLAFDRAQESVFVEGTASLRLRVSAANRVQSEFEYVELRRDGDAFHRSEIIAPKMKVVLRTLGVPSLQDARAWESIPLQGESGFFVKGAKDPLPLARERTACVDALPHLDTSWRVDTYEMEGGDAWQGTAQGPTFEIPPDAVALVCTSGARHSAGLRLRMLDTNEVVRVWLGANSGRPTAKAADLSAYQGRSARFEIYDRDDGEWGHVRVYGLGIMKRVETSK